MASLIIYMCVVSTFLLFGMVGDREEKNRRNYTYAFCTCIIAMAVLAMKIV